MDNASLSIVIPVFNSGPILRTLIERLHPILTLQGASYETILVNDGSSDQSWDVICGLAAQYDWVRGINLMRNYGQHNALLCGIREAKHDVIVTMDDDLQNPPEEIPKLLSKLAEGYDVVYGTPLVDRHGLWRGIASRITRLALQGIMGAETARKASAFRAFRSKLRDSFISYQSPFVSIDVLLTWSTTQFAAIQVKHEVRRIGRSNYTFRKLITHALNMITGFSSLPLQLASLMGFAFSFFGLGVLAYVVGRYLILGHSIPGFPFLSSIIAIFSGAQLFALGIIGEYLARMHFQSMGRPHCAIRDKVGANCHGKG